MHPNLYLETLWRMDLRPEVFVAMGFGDEYRARYDEVIVPAVEAVSVSGIPLKPNRVDLSASGDSILTEIIDGIAHSELFLADISTAGYDAKTSQPYRNGNVMYEVGLALACRQPSEVLLIKDDDHKSLFDVSTIPYARIDFTDVETAKGDLQRLLEQRLGERNRLSDARVALTLAQLSPEEISLLGQAATSEGFSPTSRLIIDHSAAKKALHTIPNPVIEIGTSRLLDKQIIRFLEYRPEKDQTVYEYTTLGHAVVLAAAQRSSPS